MREIGGAATSVRRRQIITLYVNNIAEKLHWKVSVARHQPRKSYWRRVHSGTGSDTHREGNTGNEGVKGSSRRPDAVLKENVEEKPKHDEDQKIWDVVELEVGSLVCNVRIVEVGFMDNSSKKTDTRSGGSPWKEKGRNSPTVSSSSESQSPMTGGTKRFQDVEVAINADDGGTHSNHD
ncbi:hypothetical protein V6N11_034855 [Hibiscus sabdariffa]|uniref:Uncharacterized protein n=1 Tax=Hibiscus sabdariffa TaxID=183260 RepID=A0ABR2AI11_9ROSI